MEIKKKKKILTAEYEESYNMLINFFKTHIGKQHEGWEDSEPSHFAENLQHNVKPRILNDWFPLSYGFQISRYIYIYMIPS